MNAQLLFDQLLTLPVAEQRCFMELIRATPELWDVPESPCPDRPSNIHYLLVFDGGSRGNPGQGYGSYALTRRDTGEQRLERLDFPGRITGNEAEYLTLIEGLRSLLKTIRDSGHDPRNYGIEVRGDSKLVINQVTRQWKVRSPRMQKLYGQARALVSQFGRYRLIHHGRENSVRILGH